MIIPTRRGFIGGMLSLLAAPAIVRVASLMPISVPKVDLITSATESYAAFEDRWEPKLYRFYSGYDVINVSEEDMISAARFDWQASARTIVSCRAAAT